MIKAIIFDMDGVISDTQRVHSRFESQVLAEIGIKLSPEKISKKYAGISSEIMFEEILTEHKKIFDVQKLIVKKRSLMIAAAKEGVIPVPGIFELINNLLKNNFKLAVGSASKLNLINIILTRLQIKNKFYAIASCEECENGKPNPAVFLLAAKRLNISPSECLVIEDGFSGMLAAKTAGMKCIALVEDIDEIYPADLKISSLKDLTIEQIKNL